MAQVVARIRQSRRAAVLAGVAFDARAAVPNASGIGHTAIELLRGLVELNPVLAVVGPGTQLPADLREHPNLTQLPVPYGPWGLRNQLRLPPLLERQGVRVLHVPDAHLPLIGGTFRRVVHVHDLIPLADLPHSKRSKKVRFRPVWRWWLRRQCAAADRIVCGSRHAAAELRERLGVPGAKLRVVPNPVRFFPVVATDFRQRYGLTGRVVAYVGRQEPYKNVVALVRALPILNERLNGERVQLVLAGRLDERFPEARHEVQRLGLANQVIFTDYLNEADLAALYRCSAVFAFPSLAEGFGLPPLEAMRFGVPVLAGRTSCLPEVLGEAARYADPADPADLAAGLHVLLSDDAEAERLRQAGFRRVARYSRRRAARSLLRLYRELLPGHAPA